MTNFKKLFFVLLVCLLPIIFLLQAGLGLKENLVFLPFILLPLPIYLYLLLKFGKKVFEYKFLYWDCRRIIAGFVMANLLFQYQFIYKNLPVMKFNDQVFAKHFNNEINTIETRMVLSFASAINLIPLFGDWKINVDLLHHALINSNEVFYIKQITEGKKFKEVCLRAKFDNLGDCSNDLIYKYTENKEVDTTTGILLTTVGAVNIFEAKEESSKEDDLVKFNSNALSSIQLIELTNNISFKMDDYVLRLEGDAYLRILELEVLKKFLKTTKEKISGLIKTMDKGLSASNRKIAANDMLLIRFNAAKKNFESFHQLKSP